MRRRPWGTKRELWDCAIPGPEAAESAVRRRCKPAGVILITAHTALSAAEIGQLGLRDGQLRKRRARKARAVDA